LNHDFLACGVLAGTFQVFGDKMDHSKLTSNETKRVVLQNLKLLLDTVFSEKLIETHGKVMLRKIYFAALQYMVPQTLPQLDSSGKQLPWLGENLLTKEIGALSVSMSDGACYMLAAFTDQCLKAAPGFSQFPPFAFAFISAAGHFLFGTSCSCC